jgi:2-haloacid dehalogenase
VTGREVLAFDLYGTLVDPLALSSELGRVLGDSDGREAARLWRLKQLEYTFRLTAMSRYEDFRWVTSRALDFALASVGARVPSEQAQRLVELYDHLQPFPRRRPRAAGARRHGVRASGAFQRDPRHDQELPCQQRSGGFFGQRISVDEVRVFKLSPVVYRHAAGRLSVPVGQIRLVTSNAFDSVGPARPGCAPPG